MLVKYGYRTREDKKCYGLFQCEVEDFREFFKNFKENIMNCVVIMENESWVCYKDRLDKVIWKKFSNSESGLIIWNDKEKWDRKYGLNYGVLW